MDLILALIVFILTLQVGCAQSTTKPEGNVCWSNSNFTHPSIGLHLGHESGTVVAAFPNGTFANIVSIATNTSDRNWMLQKLVTSTKTSHRTSNNHLNVHTAHSDLPTDIVLETTDKTAPPLVDLLRALKQQSEDYTGTEADILTVSYPPYFDEDQKRHLSDSLDAAGIQDSICHTHVNSAVTAALAHRQDQMHISPATTALECTHGNFGWEMVIFIEHTEAILTMQKFELYVSDDTAEILPESNLDVFLKSPKRKNEDDDFWGKVTTHLQRLLSSSSDYHCPENVYHLVLIGSLARDSKLIEALAKSADELLPPPGNASVPLAARMLFSPPDPIDWERENEWRGRCRYNFDHTASVRKFYGNMMLSRIHEQETTAAIDPQFASARGAALMGIDSKLRPCVKEGKCEFANCPEKTEGEDGSWGVFYMIASLVKIAGLRHENYSEYSRHSDTMTDTSRQRLKEYKCRFGGEGCGMGHSWEL